MTLSRVTIDIDSHVPSTRLRVLRAAHALERMGAEVKVAVSSSQTGYHVVGHFDRPLTGDEKMDIRRNLCDDPNRIRMDEQRARNNLPTQTMWGKKSSNDGVRHEFDTAEDAIEYVERTKMSAHLRAKNIQNHGRKAISDREVPHTKEISEL